MVSPQPCKMIEQKGPYFLLQKLARKGKTSHIYSEISLTKKCLTHHSVIKISVEELECASRVVSCGISAVGRGRSNSSSHHLRDDVFSACLSQTCAMPEARKHRTGTEETWRLFMALPQMPWVATSLFNIPWIQRVSGTWMSSPSQFCAVIFKGKFHRFSSDRACATAEHSPLLRVHGGASSMAPGVCNREQEYKLWDCHLQKINFVSCCSL